MGSSKKHKEKRDRKKHKKDRSRSRERDGHKKSHKSSHRRDKRHSPEDATSPVAEAEIPQRVVNISDDEFDVDRLLDSKLSEVIDISKIAKKRKREGLSEEAKKRLRMLGNDEDSLERFATQQLLEDSGQVSVGSIKQSLSPPRERVKPGQTSFSGFRYKEEPREEDATVIPGLGDLPLPEPQLSLSIEETNKLRAKLGLKPLDSGKPSPAKRSDFSGDPQKSKVHVIARKPQVVSEPIKQELENFEQDSLSISDTNKLRAKLGLKPLDVGSEIPGIGNEEKEIAKPAVEVFVKTENIREKKKSEDLREKLKVIKEKRAIEEKLKKTKGIADSDSEDESASAWVMKHQKILKEKEEAEKRAKLLEEMDAEFGIGALVEEEFDKKKTYSSHNLKGLTVAHDMESIREGSQVILTLKDKGVLEEEDDVLENVNLVDNERYARNIENKKKKPDYKPYDEPEYDEFGILKKKNLLSKYDEEIEGEMKKTFKLGTVGDKPHMSKEQELELIRMKLKQQNVMTLDMPEMKIANEYYTADDMVRFKKPKKRRKVKRSSILKADDLIVNAPVDDSHFGSRRRTRRREIDDEDMPDTSASGIPFIRGEEWSEISTAPPVIEEEEVEKEFHSALHKARKLKERKVASTAPEKVIEILSSVSGMDSSKAAKDAVNIEMNSVAEFCRTLGDIPTYGMSGNREEEAEDMMDMEKEMDELNMDDLEAQNQGAWNEVDVEERPAEISMRENEPILEEEPDIMSGVAGALKLAQKKGYLDKEAKNAANANRASMLQAQSYTIEEKFYEDDKFGKRDRYTGPVQEFKDKTNYKPDVKLEYIDDNGRLLTAKEAFRYLSHKFHGKGPGKNKVDKRMKKVEQDTRLKQMSSTDTPLNTVKLLQLKQKETQSPYIVLSGGNKTLTQTMISKTKPV